MPYLGYNYTKKCICCVSENQVVVSEQARKDSKKRRDKIILIFFCDARLVLPCISRGNTLMGIILLIFKGEREKKMPRLPRTILLYTHDGALRNQSKLYLNQRSFRSKENKSIPFDFWKQKFIVQRERTLMRPLAGRTHTWYTRKLASHQFFSVSPSISLILLAPTHTLLPSLLLSKSTPLASPSFLLP